MTMRCAVLQTAPTFGEVERNLSRLATTLAGLGPVDLVVGPELATTGYDITELSQRGDQLAEPLDGPSVERLRQLAVRHETTLIVGMLEADDDAVYDTVVTCRPDGATFPYRKTHLYPAEQKLFTPGNTLVTVPTDHGRIGPMICFEHAFPEVATTLALAGAQVLVIPSAVPDGYEHLLELRSRARAQDNQVFVIAANLAATGFFGRSLVVDPRGDVLARAGAGEQVLTVEIDLAAIGVERQVEPALRLRRPELYDLTSNPQQERT